MTDPKLLTDPNWKSTFATYVYLLRQPQKCIANFRLWSRRRDSKHLIMCLHSLTHTHKRLRYASTVRNKNTIIFQYR